MIIQRTTLERLEAGLRASGAHGRKTITTQAFQIFLSMRTDDYVMSYAVPHGAEPSDWLPALRELRAMFDEYHRRPRLEFIHELHPTLAAALETTGFQNDMTAPIMILTPQQLTDIQDGTSGTHVRLSHENPELLELFLRRQSLAYGGRGDDSALAWLPNLTQGLQEGTVLAAALELDNAFVTGATIMLGGDVGELAGVWTLPEKQRQGLAYTMCQRLLKDYFAQGHTLCWLSSVEGAQRLYHKLGFTEVGTQLNYGAAAKPVS